MLSVQGKSGSVPWPEKDARAFFRGRDSRQERLDLVQLVRDGINSMENNTSVTLHLKSSSSLKCNWIKSVSGLGFWKGKDLILSS